MPVIDDRSASPVGVRTRREFSEWPVILFYLYFILTIKISWSLETINRTRFHIRHVHLADVVPNPSFAVVSVMGGPIR